MSHRPYLWSVLVLFLPGCEATPDHDRIQGEWQLGVEEGDFRFDLALAGKASLLKLRFSDDRFTAQTADDPKYTVRGTYDCNPNVDPRQITFRWSGPQGNRIVKAIYWVSDDALAFRVGQRDEEPPNSFYGGTTRSGRPARLGFDRCPPDPVLPEPMVFSHWPSATEKPIPVLPAVSMLCTNATPQQAGGLTNPHAGGHSIVVRMSPDSVAPFRANEFMPLGAIVVKEKHVAGPASIPLSDYAMMIKRHPGYYPEGGDWEYVYVTLSPERKVLRGRLAECAKCHSAAKDRDFLFRSYYGIGQMAK
jgi:uncharacterized protein (TIGR03067 family)